MKNLKKLLVLCLLACVVVAVSSCFILDNHVYVEDWTYDENGHWHSCVVDGCSSKSEEAVHTYDAGEVITPATEEAEGVISYTCTVCGYAKTEAIAKLPHTHKLTKVDEVAPTCTAAGTKAYYTCSGCDQIFSDEEGQNAIAAPETIDALGHSEEIIAGKDATCTEKGLSEGKKCSVCGETLVAQEEIAALGHTEEILPAKAATCTETGLTEGKKCSVCGEILVAQQEIAAGHKEEILPAKAATCTETGLTEGKKCSVCGETLVAQQETPVAPHTEETVAGKAATCTEAGLTEGKKCSVCGETLVAQQEIAAAGHKYENCECSVCHETVPALDYADSFDFATADGFAAVQANGKIVLVGEFRNNGDSHQFGANSSIQFVVPANTTVTITGHSTSYGVFDVYLNGVKTDMAGVLSFTVKEETKVVIVPDEEATYSKAYLKGISLEAYVDRTITEDTTINFGSEGNYKDSIVDFSGIQIGDNGGNNSQVKNGSFQLIVKAGAKVVIHGYSGYTSYKVNDGEEITAEWYTYIALEDTTLTVTPVNGNNYFYSIEITYHEGIQLVNAAESTCTVAGHEAYYTCTCHGELTQKVARELAPHTEETVVGKAATCTETGLTDGTKCSVCQATVKAQEEIPVIDHNYVDGKCSACGAIDPSTTITVYFENNWNWTEVRVHYWGSSAKADTTWPGVAPTKIGSKNGKELYEIVIPADVAGIVISGLKDDNSGYRDQTPNIETGLANCVCYSMLWNNGNHVNVNYYHNNETTTVDPDCTNPGSKTEVCKVCGKTETTELAAKGHTEETVTGKAATCTETGLTDGIKCSVCGETVKAQEEIPALDHNMITDVAKAPTCTETGLTEGAHCSRCDHKVAQQEIPANGHSEEAKHDDDYHWTECVNCDYATEKVAHTPAEEGKCACGYACADKCAACGKCENTDCALCATKCEFAVADQVITFAPSTTLGAPEGPNGLAPGKDGAYLHDESITAQHVVLENGAFATVITLPNGTAAHSGISLLNNKNQDTYGKAGYNCGIPQIDGVANNIKLYFTNNGDSAVTFKYSAIDYYYDKGAVELTLAAGETKVVIMPTTHTASVGLNHQIVFPNGADAGASITVWGEFIADENLASVTVATPANQLRFGVGETFSAAGLVLKANGTNYNRVYISGNYITNLDGYTFTSSDVGTHTVFVMFGDVAVTYSIIVDDHAHNVVYVEEQAPVQCEKDGLAAHYACTVEGCGLRFADKYGNEILESIASVSCHTESTGPHLPGSAITCTYCSAPMGIVSMDNWVHFAITTQTSKIGSNIKNGKLEHAYINGVPGTKVYIGAGTVGATNDSEFYLQMSNNDTGWQTVIPNLGTNAPAGQLRRVILFYRNYSNEDVTMNLQNDASGGNGKVTIPANGTAICEFTIKNKGGSNWFHYYVDSNVNSDVVLGVYGYFYVYNEEVDSISVNKPATKLTYKVGESFTSEGLVVNVPITMSNSKTCYAQTGFTTNYDGRIFTADDIGVHTVTVTFGDNTTTYTIEVVPEVNCEGGEHKYGKVSEESLFVEMQGNNAIYKKACVYCGAASEETYVAETVAFVPHATNKTNFKVEYVTLEDGRIAVKLTVLNDIAAGHKQSISTSINNAPSGTNAVFPVSGNGRRVYMEMISNADVNITWQPEFYGDRDGVTMDLKAGESQSNVWVVCYDNTTNPTQTQAALPYEEFVFNTDVAAGTEIYITGLFYDRGDIIDVNVNTPAKQIIYKVGEEFSSEGFSFGVSSTDSLFAKVTIYNVTTNLDGKVFTSDDLGVHKVVVSWGEFTAEYDILVIE